MKISYDYEEMINELKEDMKDGILSITDTIQVLRSDKPIYNSYKPIIDWYYKDSIMQDDMKPGIFDEEYEIEEKVNIKEQYERDKPFLEEILVSNCLIEMVENNEIQKYKEGSSDNE